MMMIEDIKKDINNSLKEIQENTGKHNQTGKGKEQSHPGSENETSNNKEITKGDNSGV